MSIILHFPEQTVVVPNWEQDLSTDQEKLRIRMDTLILRAEAQRLCKGVQALKELLPCLQRKIPS